MSKIKYPKDEKIWVSYNNSNGELRYIITSKQTRDFYFLYELADGVFKKIGKAKTPTFLENKYKFKEKL